METNSSASFPEFCAIFQKDFHLCFTSMPVFVCFKTYIITNTTIQLPLCMYIIYLGFQRQRSGKPMRHSDFFTCHSVAVELIGILATLATILGTHTNLCLMSLVGIVAFFFYGFGQMSINVLACGECYLAAVYPIIYLRLRKAKGVRLRNIAVSCTWLSTFGSTIFIAVQPTLGTIVCTCLLGCAVIFVSFLCVSVLCVLTVPGPGKGGGASVQVDKTKLKAFYVMMIVMGVLLFRFGGNMVSGAIFFTPDLGINERCIGYISSSWTYLPSGVLLPLLYLRRAGKLACIKKHKPAGQAGQRG